MKIVRGIDPVTRRPIALRLISPAERAAQIERARLENARPAVDDIFTSPLLRQIGLSIWQVRELLSRREAA